MTTNHGTGSPLGPIIEYGSALRDTDSATMPRQAAVPKSMQLQLAPPSSPTVPAGGTVSQQMEISNPSQAVLRQGHTAVHTNRFTYSTGSYVADLK